MRVRTAALFLALVSTGAVSLSACSPTASVASLAIPMGLVNGENARLLLVGRSADLTFSYAYRLREDGTFSARATIGGPSDYNGTYTISSSGTITLTANPGSNPAGGPVTRVRIYHEANGYVSRNLEGNLTGPGTIF